MYKKLKRKNFLVFQAFMLVLVLFLFGCYEEKLMLSKYLKKVFMLMEEEKNI